ncbi:ornithine carbamoyltransferase [Umboniibacter marinipuniceus]|uniref:Ornithine carbamoyltransferase n=1 Tax=Umboniibacter marinipuniceus TaxID=569599 RepID=A0A3M0A4Q7_9GAMM|nr:ornithine carbamoyltransferase [Umboniibacter marinipuniceus]RMA80023.1 ornithine carbamoyltransferase [Umboniibacter marinipuniceus]
MLGLHGRSFLKLLDFSAAEINDLVNLAAELKAAKRDGTEVQRLKRKNIALIFEKDSTRTRCAFEVAAFDQGAQVTFIGPQGGHMGAKETVADTARVLGRMYDGIQYRGYGQEIVETLAANAGVPVWNGLTDEFHPTQILADLLTIKEQLNRPWNEVAFCYLGDGRNNMGNSLMVGAAKLGIDFRIAAPASCQPDEALVAQCRELAKESGASIQISNDIDAMVAGADVIYTDVWVSMGEPESVWDERVPLLLPYQVNEALMAKTGKAETIFLHCLPAFHNTETKVGEAIKQRYSIDAMEVSDSVFEGRQSVVFDQAENRLHTIKAVMVATLSQD